MCLVYQPENKCFVHTDTRTCRDMWLMDKKLSSTEYAGVTAAGEGCHLNDLIYLKGTEYIRMERLKI